LLAFDYAKHATIFIYVCHKIKKNFFFFFFTQNIWCSPLYRTTCTLCSPWDCLCTRLYCQPHVLHIAHILSKYIFITSSFHDHSYSLDLRPFGNRNISFQLFITSKNIWFGFGWQFLITLTRGQTVCMQMPTDWSRTMFANVVFTLWPFVLYERVNFILFYLNSTLISFNMLFIFVTQMQCQFFHYFVSEIPKKKEK
jgi:hypothetical protein